MYFDTPDLLGYLLAAHRRRRGFKVRSRCYDASGLAFLEVKTRDGARTVKTRLEGRHVLDDRLTREGRAFVAATLEDAGIEAAVVSDLVSDLVPVLRTRYRRSTLHLAGRRQPGHRRPRPDLVQRDHRCDELAARAGGRRDQVRRPGIPDGPAALVGRGAPHPDQQVRHRPGRAGPRAPPQPLVAHPAPPLLTRRPP